MRSILIQVLEVGDLKMQMQNRGADLCKLYLYLFWVENY